MNPTSLDGPVTRPPPLHVSLEAGVLTLTNTDAPWNRMSLDYMDAVEHAVRLRRRVIRRCAPWSSPRRATRTFPWGWT
jgi:hypothetical protein